MAETIRPPHSERLLIKLIMPKQGTERKVQTGGYASQALSDCGCKVSCEAVYPSFGYPHCHRSADAAGRSGAHSREVDVESGREKPPAGKSVFAAVLPDHRRRASRGIIRQGNASTALTASRTSSRTTTSDRMTKELSCVDTIEPVTPAYRRSGMEAKDVFVGARAGKMVYRSRAAFQYRWVMAISRSLSRILRRHAGPTMCE